MLLDLLKDHRYRTLLLRKENRDKGLDYSYLNREIELVDKMQDELRRTMEEWGWLS